MSEAYAAASHLAKSFGDRRVLTDLSFTVERGDVVGVLGKNGAGKTTLLELLLGFTPATSGTVTLFGHDSYRLPGKVKTRIGFVPQQDELLGHLRVDEQLRVIASFYPTWDHELIRRLIHAWEIDPAQRVMTMSVGQRQRLSILLALGHRPDLLILDEPVASLDPIARRQFLEQIVELAADGATSVILSSHIVSDVERLANKIWILKGGNLEWQGDMDSLKESIVRVHVRGGQALPKDFAVPRALSQWRTDTYSAAVVRDWTPASRRELEAATGAEIEAEPLALEEIFLELHR
jgi:ABC-2 type transport system ATP-binding protein